MDHTVNILRNYQTAFHSGCTILPAEMYENSNSFTSCNIWYNQFLLIITFNRCGVVLHYIPVIWSTYKTLKLQ